MRLPVWFVAVVLVVSLMAQAAAGSQDLDPARCDYHLVLDGALPGNKALHVYVNAADKGSAFALSPTFNKALHRVDASGLTFAKEKLSGTLAVTIAHDGYVPRDGKPINLRLTLDASVDASRIASKVAGTFAGTSDSAGAGEAKAEGTVSGTLAPLLPTAATVRLSLNLADAIPAKNKTETARITLSLRDGKALAPKLWPRGSLVDTAMSAEVTENTLEYHPGKLAGSLTVKLVHQGAAKPVSHTFAFKGTVIDSAVAGTFTRDGAAGAGQTFSGTVDTSPAPSPGDAQYNLMLQGTPANNYTHLHLATRAGKIVGAFAATPNWNNATHELDTSALTLAGNALKGDIKLVIHPDPWHPKDGKPFPAAYRIDATVDGREVTGTYEGAFDTERAAGKVEGDIAPLAAIAAPARVTLKIENGLVGGNTWQNRAFVSMELDPAGNVTGGKISNNHTKLSGAVESGTVKWTPEGFEATVTFTAAPGGNVTEGKYTVTARGPIVGNIAAGNFETSREGKVVKTGRFWAAVSGK